MNVVTGVMVVTLVAATFRENSMCVRPPSKGVSLLRVRRK